MLLVALFKLNQHDSKGVLKPDRANENDEEAENTRPSRHLPLSIHPACQGAPLLLWTGDVISSKSLRKRQFRLLMR